MKTEKKGFSKREIRLLLMALSVALLAFMVIYVYIPLFDELNDKTSEYNELMLDRVHIDSMLASESSTRENHKAAIMRHDSYSSRFLSQSLISGIGRMLTDLCLSHRLQPITQLLSAPMDFSVVSNEDGVGDIYDAIAGSSDTDSDPADDETVFLIVSASMSVRGSYNDLKLLLDSVENTGYIRVSRVSFESDAEAPDAILDRIMINFQITMLRET